MKVASSSVHVEGTKPVGRPKSSGHGLQPPDCQLTTGRTHTTHKGEAK